MATPKIGRQIYEELEIKASQPVLKEPEIEAAPTPEPLTPEEAAEFLIPFLPEDAQALIREAHRTLARPFWQLLLGYTLRCHEVGEMFAPMYLSAWESGNGKPNTDRPCAHCGRTFFSRFPEAMYCCSPCFFEKLATTGHAEDCPAMAG